MYTVSGNLTRTYGSDIEPVNKLVKTDPDMPHVTSGNKRMTNVKLSNGEFVQGIRKNKDDSLNPQSGSHEAEPPLRPLRYTPGLKCDPHLESLRPERSNKHPALSGGDGAWRQKLVKPPETYEGSFADADMDQFRPPESRPPPPTTSDPWYSSRVPDPQYFPTAERLVGPPIPAAAAGAVSPYDQIYPQDELSRIKMRNRRFQNSCGSGGVDQQMMYPQHPMMMQTLPYYGYPPQQPYYPMMPPPMMQPQTIPMMQQPNYSNPSSSVPLEDLAILDQELNMTRRITRPFVPTETPEFSALQKERDFMEEPKLPIPMTKPKSAYELCPTSVDQLPKPKRSIKADKKDLLKEDTKPSASTRRQDVRIADQIAIRSMVLGKNLPNIGSSAATSEIRSKTVSSERSRGEE